jgi:hypothetical protein
MLQQLEKMFPGASFRMTTGSELLGQEEGVNE